MPKLTIAILTYNRAHYLVKMLDSIQKQTYTDFYAVIYDNHSEDNTPEAVLPYLEDRRFSYIRNDINMGGKNINRVLKDCNTQYLIITHDDDFMEPDMIEKEVAILDKYNNVIFVSVKSKYVDENDCIIPKIFPKSDIHDLVIEKRKFIEVILQRGNIITMPAVMFNMELFRLHDKHFQIETVGAPCDCYMWLELNQFDYNIYIINEQLYNYRKHSGQDSQNELRLWPHLKKPVYELLQNNSYPNTTIKKWQKYVNTIIFDVLKKSSIKKEAYKRIKNIIYLINRPEFYFRLRIFILIYMPFLAVPYTFVKRVIKKNISRIIKE